MYIVHKCLKGVQKQLNNKVKDNV